MPNFFQYTSFSPITQESLPTMQMWLSPRAQSPCLPAPAESPVHMLPPPAHIASNVTLIIAVQPLPYHQSPDNERPGTDRVSFAPENPQPLMQAEHHPDLPMQPPTCSQGKKKLTEQQKNARDIATDATQRKNEALVDAILTFIQKQEESIEELAKKHDVKTDYIRAKIQHLSNLRSMDQPSVYQATVH